MIVLRILLKNYDYEHTDLNIRNVDFIDYDMRNECDLLETIDHLEDKFKINGITFRYITIKNGRMFYGPSRKTTPPKAG